MQNSFHTESEKIINNKTCEVTFYMINHRSSVVIIFSKIVHNFQYVLNEISVLSNRSTHTKREHYFKQYHREKPHGDYNFVNQYQFNHCTVYEENCNNIYSAGNLH